MTPFEVYKDYLALKQHFNTDSYDYLKYNGKVSAKRESFEKRNDRYFFEKIAKHTDPHGYLVANFLCDPKFYIRSISPTIYENWIKQTQSLSNLIKNELKYLNDNFNSNFKPIPNEHPIIVRLYLSKEISMTTFMVLVDITKAHNNWKKSYSHDIIMMDIIKKIEKTVPFIKYNKEKITQILLDYFQ